MAADRPGAQLEGPLGLMIPAQRADGSDAKAGLFAHLRVACQ